MTRIINSLTVNLMPKSNLIKQWEAARDDLGLDMAAPFALDLGDGEKLRAEILVRNFGARNGMLIARDYAAIKPYLEDLWILGYGFSILEEPKEAADKSYNREVFIAMLRDWGWSGDKTGEPRWLKPL